MHIEENVALAPHTTLKAGGPAEYFVRVSSAEELQEACRWARARSLPLTVLAGGSNVLVADEGVPGLVVHIALSGIVEHEEGDRILLTVGAGETLDEVIGYAVERGWWGLENLSCIPGSCGATPVQNVGAYGVETADIIERVEVYDTAADELRSLTAPECAFAYRDSLFKRPEGAHVIITEVTYRLSCVPHPQLSYRDLADWASRRDATSVQGEAPSLSEIRQAVCAIRSHKFPDWREVGTAGSFFKNPTVPKSEYERLVVRYPELPGHETADGSVKLPLGWILDHVLGMRGVHEGRVGTYEHQALVVVSDGARAREIDAFADGLARRVHEATGLTIEREVTRVPK